MLLLQLVEVAPVVAVLNADCRLFLLLFLCGCVAQLDFRFAHCLLTRPVNIYHLLQGSAEHTGHAAPAATPRVCKHQFAATFDLSVDLPMFAPVSAQKGEIEW